MWRQAYSELRIHPGRFSATLVAIAISVGFIAAISVFINSQQTMFGNLSALGISKADVVVGSDEMPEDAVEAIGDLPGVEGAYPEPIGMSALLSVGDRTIDATIFPVQPEPLRWSRITEGRLPDSAGEIALSEDGLKSLGAHIGTTITFEEFDQSLTVVGATDDPRMLWSDVGYMGGGQPPFGGRTAVVVSGQASEESVMAEIRTLAQDRGWRLDVQSGEQARTEAFSSLTAEVNILKQLLQGFGAVALLVGMITIANTFTILVAQRRRQLALLRAIGATPGQVTGRLIIESFLIGAIGSAAGIGIGFLVAWIGGSVTGSNYFGLTVRPLELLLAWAAGTLVTMLAATLPAIRAARVKPLEALQSVPTASQARRAGVARIVICGVAAALGVLAVFKALGGVDAPVAWALGAGAAISVAVFGAAPLYVAPVLALLGRILGFAGPSTRMAFTNAARNPRRASSTATALMLAVGLIVTLQAGLATARTSGMATIEKEFPIDVVLSTQSVMPGEVEGKLKALSGVRDVATITSKRIDVDGESASAYAPGEAYAALGLKRPNGSVPDDGVLLVGTDGWLMTVGNGEDVTVPGASGPVTLRVKKVESLAYEAAIVSEATLAQLAGEGQVTQLWLRLQDRTSETDLNQVMRVIGNYPDLMTDGGGALMASALSQVLGVMLIVLTALLGVAVLIALVGVGNTLGLSVMERQRESALLRALGMQRTGLRMMLLVEAVAMVAVGTAIGLAAGSFFGWLGVRSVVGMMPDGLVEMQFGLDGWYTAGLILVCLVAAVLASILPGRKAANAAPMEALAVE